MNSLFSAIDRVRKKYFIANVINNGPAITWYQCLIDITIIAGHKQNYSPVNWFLLHDHVGNR